MRQAGGDGVARAKLYMLQYAIDQQQSGISGLVVKSIVAIDGPRVRFTADA